jgi:hypothetical protein
LADQLAVLRSPSRQSVNEILGRESDDQWNGQEQIDIDRDRVIMREGRDTKGIHFIT